MNPTDFYSVFLCTSTGATMERTLNPFLQHILVGVKKELISDFDKEIKPRDVTKGMWAEGLAAAQ